ncbi:peroxidase-related enzyme [Nisaea acidiphila]|uniref:Peroxidase-related enzyme n=1 Tax=Nisaea acidiphila TaxID=1862145 RepID=A0A9J7ATB4_9PROT|nr:peroxidase-related enzyme [Nisaea acidiphila]UUX50576.1 peroxidase-related enzyme [Nisaea acidiphila]
MSKEKVHALELGLPVPDAGELSEETRKYWDLCAEKLGLVPNVIKAYSFDDTHLKGFTTLYNTLMLGPSGLSKLEREMIAVVVSSINHCYYCLVAHGAAVRELSGAPALGEALAFNHRYAELDARQREMVAFAEKLTRTPYEIVEADRQALRDAGFTDRDIWDIANVAGFFNMSNRVASAVHMMPNEAYHHAGRG